MLPKRTLSVSLRKPSKWHVGVMQWINPGLAVWSSVEEVAFEPIGARQDLHGQLGKVYLPPICVLSGAVLMDQLRTLSCQAA